MEIWDLQQLPDFEAIEEPEPTLSIEKPEETSKETKKYIYDPSIGFNEEEIGYLQSNNLPLPNELVKTSDYEGVLVDVKVLRDKSYQSLYKLG